MKLGVTTLGCPAWTLDEILDRLPKYGYDGVELRGLGEHLDLRQSPPFMTPAAVEQTRRRCESAGLAICGIDTSCSFADPGKHQASLEEGRWAIDLAALLNCPAIRVFGGGLPDGSIRVDAVAAVAEGLAELGAYAAAHGSGVSVLLETHDSFSTGAQVAEVLASVNHPNVGALWDLHHPYRQGEAPPETFAAISPYLRLTHVKDSVPGGTYCLLGDGDVPIFEMLRLLSSGGYDGWINLEWEKRWIPELLEPELAFPYYAARLREYLAGEGMNSTR